MADNPQDQLQQQPQILSNNIIQQQKQQPTTTINTNHNLHNFSLNVNSLNNNNCNNNITHSGSGGGGNNSNNNKNHHKMSASVNSVCNTSNILNTNTNSISNNNSGIELPHNKNNVNLQNNNNSSNSKNNTCNMSNNNNNSNGGAGATLKNVNNAPTTTAPTINSNSNNNNSSGGSSNGSGKSSPANSIGGGSTNATLHANNNSNNNNNISNNNTTSISGNSSTSTSLLLRKQFIASSDASNASFSSASVAGSIQDDMSDQCSLTQAGLEEYNIRASSYYDQPAMLFHHQKQSSYAQSEGYHSYVSSSDSSSATPFLDRLRQESEMLSRQSSHHWSQNDLSSVSCASMAPSPTPLLLSTLGRDATLSGSGSSNNSVGNQQQHNNNSSESTSSTETLKWLGSMSDVSEASHATGYSAISESVSSSQLIVHSSRVLTPKRHHSESVLYLHDEHQQQQQHSPPPATQPQQQQHSPNAHVSSAKQISPTLSAREGTHSPTRLTPQTAATLLPNHRHSPSYPPVHATAAMHPYQPHPQYALRQQPQSLSHKLISALPLMDGASQSSLNASSGGDSCSIGSSTHNSKASPTLPAQMLTAPGAGEAAQSSAATTTPNSSTTVKMTAADAEPHLAPALQKPALAPKLANSNAIIEVMAVSGSGTHSPGSANAQLNASTTSLASAVSAAAALPTQSYRSNHRLFPVSTYTEKVHSNTSQFVLHPKPQYSAGLKKPAQQHQQAQKQALQLPLSAAQAAKFKSSPNSPPQPSWQTVAELINDFERTNNEPQPQKYTYMDPAKTQRVSNPALKAFQKNAVQSYFERQQQQQQQNAKEQGPMQKTYQPLSAHTQQQMPMQQQQAQQHSPSQTSLHSSATAAHQQLLRPHSYQSNMKEAAAQHQIMRSSLPNSYGAQQHHLSGQQQLALAQQHLPARQYAPPPPPPPQKPTSISHGSQEERAMGAANSYSALPTKPPSPAPPPPPPRSRSLMPHTLLRRSSSASDYAEFRDQYTRASQEKLVAQSVKNISNSEKSSFNDCGMPPPPPPPRGARPTNILPTRRTSSAAEYAAAMREKALLQQAAALAHQQHHPHQHAHAANYAQQYYQPPQPLAACNIEPGWVPERPPKNPNLRVPSPDLPPLPPSADLDTQLADEPLPPPPPELLQQQQRQQQQYYDMNASFNTSADLLPKAPSPNRRNSFAGSSTRKAYFSRSGSEMLSATKVPPLIPKKPTNIETLHAVRQHQQQQQHAQQLTAKLLLNGGMPQPQQHSPTAPPPQTLSAMANATRDAKMSSANRKRPHNPAVSGFTVPPPIMENVPQQPQQQLSSSKSPPNTNAALKSSPPPPPLMPRSMPHQTSMNNGSSNNIKARCNSKASYLPRQSLEKLNNLDPDHGSYKLTLTSNEDLVANTKPAAYDILNTHNGKMPNNLPDVLPLGAKLQPQPASPTSANASPLRYGSNNNLNTTTVSASSQQQQPMSPNCYPAYPPTQHRYSTPATMNSYNSNNVENSAGKTTNYSRSQSYDTQNNSHSGNLYHPSHASNSPTKFMSQSTMDLKRTQQLEPTLEETTAALLHESGTVLSPAQSESSLSSPCKRQLQPLSMKPLSSLGNSSDSGGGSTSGSEGRIFRAEVVTATLSTSPIAPVKSVIRKDSLRENIEKITQLQSKLMSAHQSETSLIGIYGSKTALNTTTSVPTTPTTKPENTHAQLTDDSTVKQTSDICVELTQEQNDNICKKNMENSAMDANSPQPPKSPTNAAATPTSPTANASLPQPATTVASTNTTSEDVSATQTAELNTSTESLKLVQRSEVILRVNPATTEAASQTDDELIAANNDADEHTRLTEQPQSKEDAQQQRITLQPRQRHPIEIDCEEMSQELATLLATNEKLVRILAPPTHKSPTDYVSNLYNPNVPLRPAKRDVGTSTLLRMKGHDAQEKLTVELQYAEVEVLLTNGDTESETSDLLKTKVDELMKQLNRKIRILNKEQTTLKAEAEHNDELGNSLVGKLTDKVRPIEATKCRTYIDDVGQITSLLLSLSERLARIENSLSTVSAENSAEKKSLELKRDRLLDQLAEAKRLKEDIDRRGSSVVNIVEKTLSADDFADFDYFINMKAKLIADTRDVADKIKCGEEQLNALSEALIQSDC
ncbi:protein Shroom isoform X1 [Bactrocera dorsalis]|uniref:Protein Shroom isoform X1 n=2 Tax=Bactrocera dorsalis TaxID=27457 RepID=A0ABM3JJP9_BACDO|nr:protein Shroom isoform X1 [Bactrocera dorsalis]XP_049309450.1 protein Shroom isoform X1 [Bactrocera dorsalis]XP_049309451.1 protein Shroom isoform X1 [Bactrocera dorsalis]